MTGKLHDSNDYAPTIIDDEHVKSFRIDNQVTQIHVVDISGI